MAQPTGHQNIMLNAAQGSMPSGGAPTLIPNGQPPQWNRPPIMPHAMKSRPPPTGSNVTPAVSNGTPTPSNCSHPGSSSSQSSRGPSPIPPNRHNENFFNSTPNLTTPNSQPLHSESPSPSGIHRGSPGANINASQHRIPHYNNPGMSSSLVNQNIGQSRSASSLTSSHLPPAHGSGSTSTSNLPTTAPLEKSSHSHSQDTFSMQHIPSQYSDQQQRLGTVSSQLPLQNLGHNNSNNSKQQNVDNGPETSRQNAVLHSSLNSVSNDPQQNEVPTVPRTGPQGIASSQQNTRSQQMEQNPGVPVQRSQPGVVSSVDAQKLPVGMGYMQSGNTGVSSLPGYSQPSTTGSVSKPPTSLNQSYPGIPFSSSSQNVPGISHSGSGQMPPPSSAGYAQPGISRLPPSSSSPEMPPNRGYPNPPSSGGYPQHQIIQPGMPSRSTGYPQSGIPATSVGYTQPGMSPANSGFAQTGMPPTSAGFSRPGMPPSSGYSQPGMPPHPGTTSGFTQLGMPPTSGVSQTGLPPTSGVSQTGLPPTSRVSQTGMPLTSAQPRMPSTSTGFFQSGKPPLSGPSQSGMPPTSAGFSHPGMPPTSTTFSQPQMLSTNTGFTHPGKPPSSAFSQPGIPPTSSTFPQQGMPPTGSTFPQQGMPPTSSTFPQQGMPPTSSTFPQQGMPPTSSTFPQQGMPPTSSTFPQQGMPPTSTTFPQQGMAPTSGYSQPAMPPTGGFSQPGMPSTTTVFPQPNSPSSGFSQPGMPPTNAGFFQQGMPPTSPGSYPQPSMPNQYPGPPQTGANQQDGSHHLGKRYPQQQYQQNRGPPGGDAIASQMSGLSVTQMGFNKLWGMESVDLLQNRNVLPADKIEPPKIRLHQEFLDSVNCSTEIFRCTLTKIPETNSLLQKSRLPLGILIHPFKDLNVSHLPVIQCSTIVRCRSCRTYINPFVYFVDHKRWKCNLCFRVNELPEEFQYDPVSKTYGDPTRRPEVKSSTIEFIAPSEYMLRPPQPAVYLFLLDVSRLAVDCGYLQLLCDILLEELDKLPGDGRTQIGFITYDSCVHFYNLAEGLNQPQQMIVVDTEDVFLPCPDNLLVNLSESRELVKDLLNQIPSKFLDSHDTNSSLGAALQAAYKLMAPTGGRVTVFQTCLPNHGPGMLTVREDPSQRAGKEAPHLNPATDFYKRLALDCSGQQIAVDLFLINSQYSDLATLSGISRFSGGCIYHFPLFRASNTIMADSLERSFRRYLTRKIGFEAVMRIRCSRGLAIHTFHGNFFVRSTDLLSLPNVNPDAGFGMQVSIEESLSDLQNICFQAALLYTSSKGERRIRVHTLCLPVGANLSDILYSADQQCIVGLLAKMAVDRSHQSSLSDARDAFINVAIDVLSAYKLVQSNPSSTSLLAPTNLRLLPLYILALLKYIAFRTGQSTRLDDRLFSMCQMKSLPLTNLIQCIYPDLYPVHYLADKSVGEIQVDGVVVPQPPRLHLSAEKLDSHGAFLMDTGDHMMMYVGHNISSEFCSAVLGVPAFSHIPEEMFELPENESPESEKLRNFVNHLHSEKPYQTMFQVIRDDSHYRAKFIERLIEDRSESALSYYEFLQHLKSNVK